MIKLFHLDKSCFFTRSLGVIPFIFYDFPENASRECWATGNWNETTGIKTDYSNCTMIEHTDNEEEDIVDEVDDIYMVGYSLSLLALTIALIIFLKFR